MLFDRAVCILYPHDNGEAQRGRRNTDDDRCEKVDFLFIVDDSPSMVEEQTRLINAFPQFIEAIQNKADLYDYHILTTFTETRGSTRNLA